ncbi:MAG: cytochrome c biogenesis protein ResB, partial [Sphaerochaetaceae bacterium]
MKSNVKKVLHWITSLKVAVVILALIALYIIIGTLLPQHGNQQWYIENYPKLGKLIVSLSLNNAYGSPIFLILVALFTLNL